MNFVAEKDALLDALQRIARVVERRNTIPILSCVLIEAGKGLVGLTASNMDRELTIDIEVQIDDPGKTAVDARALLDFVRRSPDGAQVEISLPKADGRLAVRAGRANAKIASLSPADFPRFPEETAAAEFELPGAVIIDALQCCNHAVSNEETRYYLNGIYLCRQSPRTLDAVATDGHRLARFVIDTDRDIPEFPGIILPRQSLDDIAKIAADVDAVEIGITGRHARFSINRQTLTTKLVDGTYPDYERVIPRDVEAGFDADRLALAAAVGRCAVIIGEKKKAIKLTPGETTLALLGRDPDAGEIEDEIDIQSASGATIGVNSDYFLAALDAMGGDSVRLRYPDSNSPITVTDPSQPAKTLVVMPYRV